jgi:hypothetical protein
MSTSNLRSIITDDAIITPEYLLYWNQGSETMEHYLHNKY